MTISFDQLPFYWRLKPPATPSPVPELQPFEYGFDESVQLVIQKRHPDTLRHLATIYREDANIGYLQDANDIAKPYGTDFTRFIDRALERWGGGVRRVLELGCGGCTILSELAARGYEVTGIDPGPLAVREGARRGLRVINDFFPTPQFSGHADFIFHNDVLEHVDRPVEFLASQRRQLSPGGLIIAAVPDCSDGVRSGEISMTMHQHLSYFDQDSLARVFEAAGLTVVAVERAAYGGSLYCCAVNDPARAPAEPLRGDAKFRDFAAKAAVNTDAVKRRVGEALRSGRRVGFYVPLRTLPYVSALKAWSGYRFFDDTSHWYGRCFDGVPVPVENYEDLRRNPVDTLFIMSLTFGRKIGERVAALGNPGMEVIQLSDLVTLDGQVGPHRSQTLVDRDMNGQLACELSVVCTVYRGERMVDELVRQVGEACAAVTPDHEIVLVDDRSPDGSWAAIVAACRRNPRVRGVLLARNVGQQRAISAGLRHATGRYTIAMDGDLQNPPEAIPTIVAMLREGHDLVYTVSTTRNNWIDGLTSRGFWWLLNGVLGVGMVPNQLMMRGFSSRALEMFNAYGEHVRNVVGLTHDIGLRAKTLGVENRKRHSDRSNYDFFRRFDVLLDVVLMTSTRPLTYLIYLSFLTMALGLVLGLVTLVNSFRYPDMPPGYPTLATLLICFGSAILAVLGIIGRYLANIYTEVRSRPLFHVDRTVNFPEDP